MPPLRRRSKFGLERLRPVTYPGETRAIENGTPKRMEPQAASYPTYPNEPLGVGQQFIVPKNVEHRTNELSLIVVTDVVAPHWLSTPIRT